MQSVMYQLIFKLLSWKFYYEYIITEKFNLWEICQEAFAQLYIDLKLTSIYKYFFHLMVSGFYIHLLNANEHLRKLVCFKVCKNKFVLRLDLSPTGVLYF